MIKQRTLRNVIKATGVGVHTGKKITLTLRPAPVNTGIIFRRVDQSPVVEIPALTRYVGDTSLSTCLMKDGVRVSTVEHLLSALYGVGVDNLYVDITADEVPIMDGSASPFLFLLQSAGVQEQSALKKFIKIKKPVEVRLDDKVAKIAPHSGFRLSFEIAFSHPFFNENNQCVDFDFSTAAYAKDIARARTFGFLSDYEKIRKMNLAAGASLDNAIVIDDYDVINKDGLRYDDECVRHKVLDAIGDLYLLGYPILGAFTGRKSGHELNRQLTHAITQQQDAWELVTFDTKKSAPMDLFPIGSVEEAY